MSGARADLSGPESSWAVNEASMEAVAMSWLPGVMVPSSALELSSALEQRSELERRSELVLSSELPSSDVDSLSKLDSFRVAGDDAWADDWCWTILACSRGLPGDPRFWDGVLRFCDRWTCRGWRTLFACETEGTRADPLLCADSPGIRGGVALKNCTQRQRRTAMYRRRAGP